MWRALAAQAADARADDDGLFRRLTYLTAFRLAIITALLAATTWFSLRPGDELDGTMAVLLYGLGGFVYAASLGYLWVLRGRRQLLPLAWAQVVGDLLVATFLVYLTGGADSLFTLMYPLAIANASVLLQRRGALGAATGAAIAFTVLVAVLALGLVPPPASYLAQRPLTSFRIAFVVIANGTAFVLTAALAASLSEQLRRTGERLTAREVDYAALARLHGSIVQTMSSGIVTLDTAGRVTFLNPAANLMTGFDAPALLGKPLAVRLPALAAAVEGALARGLARGEVDERDALGGVRRFGFVVNRLDAGGARLAIVVEDLTALRAMQEAVRRSDRLAAVGELAAGLAHELRNPLAAMTGSVELLARGENLSVGERRLMAIVLREGERLESLVSGFLAFARPSPLVPRPTDLGTLVDETLDVFRHSPIAAQVEFVRTGARELPLEADTDQLRQVLWNLLKNAAEAVQGRGRITVDVSAADDTCRLTVGDTGPGLPDDARERLFEPFFTTKPDGTGLGLALVHRIIEAHGGRIEVASGREGTTFVVLLPRREQQAVA